MKDGHYCDKSRNALRHAVVDVCMRNICVVKHPMSYDAMTKINFLEGSQGNVDVALTFFHSHQKHESNKHKHSAYQCEKCDFHLAFAHSLLIIKLH
jgi:hypothetical protein